MIADLTSFRELEAMLQSGARRRIAFVPVGCTEQHGPILPLGTDSLVARRMAEDLCSFREREGSPGVVYPVVAFTPSRSNAAYPGSTTVSEDAFRAYVADLCTSLLPHGFDAIVLLCMHGPAEPSLIEIAFRLNQAQHIQGGHQCPLLVLGVTRFGAVFQRHLGDMAGKHADFKEVVLLYKVLGEGFFDRERLEALQQFDARYLQAPPPNVEVPGVPMELRSVDGVVGRPYPGDPGDLPDLAEALWSDFVETFSSTVDRLLDGMEGI